MCFNPPVISHSPDPMLETAKLKRRELWPILASMGGICLLCWLYLWRMAADMDAMMLAMPDMPVPEWDTAYAALMFLMWAIMMIGMMLPSVTPTVLVYAGMHRKARQRGHPIAPTACFISGYLLMWIAFSALATALQWLLDEKALLSPMMRSNNGDFAAGLLIIIGLYQCLPLKESCLRHCRSPIEFISEHWRKGYAGALIMGIHHGLYCVGCCWLLMGLLFFGGVMNLLWIGGITLFVLLEKILPMGLFAARTLGLMLVAGGVLILLRAAPG